MPGSGDPPVGGDLYAVLGVAPDVDADGLARGYRRRLWALHPDVAETTHPGEVAAERLGAVQAAYALLRDPARRARYDQHRRRRGDRRGESAGERAGATASDPGRLDGAGVSIPVRVHPHRPHARRDSATLLVGPVRVHRYH